MKTYSWLLGLMTGAALLMVVPASASASGPATFRAEGCTACHSVTSKGIALDADGELATDLSKIGAKHDKKWFALLLLQKQKNDKGDTHKKKFRGEKDALKTLCEWLETLGRAPKPDEAPDPSPSEAD